MTWQQMDARAALAAWDSGSSVWSIEMGGLGPGYEQCIQIAIFELIRDNIDKPLPDLEQIKHEQGKEAASDAWWKWGNDTIGRIDAQVGGFSGAQVGAAKSLAFHILREGYAATLADVEHDRLIQVSRAWPRAEPAGVAG